MRNKQNILPIDRHLRRDQAEHQLLRFPTLETSCRILQ